MKNQIYRHSGVFAILWAFIIFVLCATPGQYIPSASWLDLLSIDKLIHASIFFILTMLFLITAIKKNQSNSKVFGYVTICIAYGSVLEWMQATFFINRSADWQDIIANSVGCLIALFLFKKIKNIIELQFKNSN